MRNNRHKTFLVMANRKSTIIGKGQPPDMVVGLFSQFGKEVVHRFIPGLLLPSRS